MPVSKKFLLWFLVAMAVLAANILISKNALRMQFDASDAVTNSLRVIDALKDVQFSTANLEIAQRNYIFSGRGEHLYSAQEALGGTREAITRLSVLLADHADGAAHLAELDAVIAEQQTKFADLRDVQKSSGFSKALQIFKRNGGGVALDRIYLIIKQMNEAQALLLAERTEQSRRYTNLSLITFYIAAFFNLLLLGLICLFSFKEIKERRRAEKVLRFTATHDPLTALPNRTLFAERLNRKLEQQRRQNDQLAVLFIDLDRFKNINDTLGHEAGDRLLKDVAQRLSLCVRRGDTIARQGGDEFVVLMGEFSQLSDIANVAQKILAEVGKPLLLDGKEFQISASIGISTFPDDGTDMQTLLKNADIAMYRAKEQGKNNYQFYAGQIDSHSVERLALEADLHRALERQELLLHYQSKVNSHTGRITGVEALLRWQHPHLGLLSPNEYISLAEETGLIVPIGEWVLRTACLQNKIWQEEGLPRLRIAVNLSPRQFNDSALANTVSRILEETGLEPRWLELEITESMVMHHPEQAVSIMRELKAMGISLSIDDFGTGYSSLAYLKRFPIDSLKVDRSFIHDLPDDADDAAITRAIIAMAHGLKLKVIAEGVENKHQAQFLREQNCNEMQGFYFSEPLPVNKFTELLKERSGKGNQLIVVRDNKSAIS